MSGVIAWRSAHQQNAIADERRNLETSKAMIVTRLQRAQEALLAEKRRSVTAAKPLPTSASPAAPAVWATSAAAAPAPSPAPVPVPAAGPRAANSLIEWLEDPKVQVLHLAFERSLLAQGYGPFFQSERLTPEQIDRLSDLIIRSRADTMDISEISRTRGLAFNSSELRAERERNAAEVKADMTALLGVERYARLLDYNRSRRVREYVSNMAGIGAVQGTPFTRETADQLVALLAAATPNYPRGGNADLDRIDWAAVEAQAASFLTPDQLELLLDKSWGTRESLALRQAERELAKQTKAAP